jgi:putative membrane protein
MLPFLLAVTISALAGSVMACVPGLHTYNVMGLLAVSMLGTGTDVQPEILIAICTSLLTSYSIASTIPAVLLAAPDESAFFTVLPGQKLLMQGRGYEAVFITAAGSLVGLYGLLLLVAPLSSRFLPDIQAVLRPHFHWILWCMIAFMLLSEWPKGGRFGSGGLRRTLHAWRSPGMGLVTFLLSGLLGFLLFYRSPLRTSTAFQNLMPAFIGLFTIPWLLLNMLTRVRPPPQCNALPKHDLVLPILRGSAAGSIGGGMAAFLPVLTGGVGGMLAGHALSIREDRAFLASQGAARAVYYVGGVMLLFVPHLHLTRGGAAWLLRPHFVPHSREHFLLFLGAVGVSACLAFLTIRPLLRITVHAAARIGYARLSLFALLTAVGIVLLITGPPGVLVAAVGTAIGLLPPPLRGTAYECTGHHSPAIGMQHVRNRPHDCCRAGTATMKGISHFAIGVAAAACFPQAVQAGAEGNPLYFVLGGVCGLLPDTLDFKLGRFLYRHDIEVTPDPLNPDVQLIADAVAYAVNTADRAGTPVRIKLNTIRMATDTWQSYTVFFDVAARSVRVWLGPEIDTGGQPVEDECPPKRKEGIGALTCNLQLDYRAATTIDILDGPVFQMMPVARRTVRPVFQPWHRLWTHSFITAFLAGMLLLPMAGWLAALVATLAWSTHVVADQLGFMGSAIVFPLLRQRTQGWKMAHSTEAGPSFAAVGLATLVVYWRLHVHAHPGTDPLQFLPFALLGFALPCLLFLGVSRAMRRYGSGDRSTR